MSSTRWDVDNLGRRSRLRRRRPHRLARMLVLAMAVGLFVVVGACAGYFLLGVEKTREPAQIHAGLAEITDVQIPTGLQPYEKSVQITGVERVEFRSASGRSYLIISTGPRFQLRHSGTLRDSRDNGTRAAGRRPESPSAQQSLKSTIRGQPAEFLNRPYAGTEAISGYFQGKKYAAHLEGEFDVSDFPVGTALALVRTIQ